jgi:hypothetical protein
MVRLNSERCRRQAQFTPDGRRRDAVINVASTILPADPGRDYAATERSVLSPQQASHAELDGFGVVTASAGR